MESIPARDLDRRLAELVRSERHLVVQFVVELAGFAKRELYRELGYTSLFHYCVRQLGLSKSSAFRRSEVARLIGRFPAIADRLREGRLSIRALVELREVLTFENHAGLLQRAEGKSQEEAQLLAVEIRPKHVPRDVVRALPGVRAHAGLSPVLAPPLSLAPPPSLAPPTSLAPSPSLAIRGAYAAVPAGTNTSPPQAPTSPAQPDPGESVPAETEPRPVQREVVHPLTPALRRLNVTVSAEFVAELEQVRAALSHRCPDGGFEQVVREAFKLVLARDRKRKGLTDQPRAMAEPRVPGANARYVPAAVQRAVWQRDQARCTWPMGDGHVCGATHRLELDHDLEVALGGKATIGNIRLLCRSHNLMKAEERFGRTFMGKFRKVGRGERDTS